LGLLGGRRRGKMNSPVKNQAAIESSCFYQRWQFHKKKGAADDEAQMVKREACSGAGGGGFRCRLPEGVDGDFY
jgi:hypothetical protein